MVPRPMIYLFNCLGYIRTIQHHIDSLTQNGRNSSSFAMEGRLFCIELSILYNARGLPSNEPRSS